MSTQRRAARSDEPVAVYSGSVAKLDTEGRVVLSDTLYAGEKLKRDADAEKAAAKAKAAAKR